MPISYLSLIDDLARAIIEAAVRENSFDVFSDDEKGKTPVQHAISTAARYVRFWHYPGEPAEIQQRLLDGLERIDDEVFRKDWGYETPSPSKLIREGHAIARAAILEVPALGPDYLDRVIAALWAARERHMARGISNDGWEDTSGYITSGIGDALREAEKLKRS